MKKKRSFALWESDKYCKTAHLGSLDVNHPGMVVLKDLAKGAERILDMGCGDGTRLAHLAKGKYGVGIDSSKKAISLAKKRYKDFEFINEDVARLPFSEESFDLVYSAYVLEHLDDPTRTLDEAVRVLKNGGKLLFVAPNFGAPNRASPPFVGSRLGKLLKGIILDFQPDNINKLKWEKVLPKEDVESYVPDQDTKVEPYLGSLLRYLKSKGLKVEHSSSCWSEELPQAKIHQKVFRILGEAGIYPFILWGPHLLAVFRKV